jgi:beta-lactamase superfamily II metal-dependent hydrolase
MYDVEFLPVGNGARSGDAILLRFHRPDNGALVQVIIDAGFQSTGDAIVEHVERYYDTRSIDLAIVTHPDGDHIGGMGTVIRELDVTALAVHRLDLRGGASLDAASAVKDLCDVAQARGTALYEPFEGLNAFGQALVVAGPSEGYYKQLVADQVAQEATEAAQHSAGGRLAEAWQRLVAAALGAFPIETDFGDAGGTNSRNNSSAVIDLRLEDRRFLFTGDAGVPAINKALDYLDAIGRADRWPDFVQIPHHGSRHNLDRATIQRLIGSGESADSPAAFISVSEEAAQDPRYPSPRILNAFGRRGYFRAQTAGMSIRHNSPDAPFRDNYSPLTDLPPLDEAIDDR